MRARLAGRAVAACAVAACALALATLSSTTGTQAALVLLEGRHKCPPDQGVELLIPPVRPVTAQYCRRSNQSAIDQSSSLGLGDLSACPPGSGFRPLSSVHPVTAVTIGLDAEPSFDGVGHTNIPFIQHLADTLREAQPGVPLNILAPQSLLDDPDIKRRLDEIFGQPPYDGFVSLQPTSNEMTKWTRDYMLPGIDGSPPHAALHAIRYPRVDRMARLRMTPEQQAVERDRARANGNPAAAELGAACGLPDLPPPPPGTDGNGNPLPGATVSGSIGGNVVALPGGVVIVGDTMAEPVKASLFGPPGSPTRPLTVQASWLKVGHADEMFNVVPTSGPPPCNFAVLYVSPARALALVDKGQPGTLEPRVANTGLETDDGRTSMPDLFPCMTVLNAKRENRIPLSTQDLAACPAVRQANARYEQIIQSNLAAVRSQLAARSGCSNPEVQPLPQLFLPKSERNPYGTAEDGAEAINPNPVNGMVVNRTMVVPDQPYGPFKDDVQHALEALGVTPRFLDDGPYHYGGGEIHCATNETRACVAQPAAAGH